MHRLKPRRPSGSALPWIIAIVAIVLAMGGTGLAAKRYLITSTSQISPTVLAKLHGAKGSRGPAGPAGATGATWRTGRDRRPGATGAAGSAKGYARGARHDVRADDRERRVRRERRAIAFRRHLLHRRAARRDPTASLIVSLADGNIGFVTQSARTVCNPNEYQVLTATPTACSTTRSRSTSSPREVCALRLEREGRGGSARRKDIRCRTTRSRISARSRTPRRSSGWRPTCRRASQRATWVSSAARSACSGSRRT